MTDRLAPLVHRAGDTSAGQFSRSGRFLYSNDHWFFKTREGVDYGPYANKTECKYAYAEFIELVANQNDFFDTPLDYQSPTDVQQPTDVHDDTSDWKIPKITFR